MSSMQMALQTGEIEFTYERKHQIEEENQLSMIQISLTRLEAKEKRIREAYENGVDSLEEYRQHKERLNKERALLQADIDAIQKTAEADTGPGKDEMLKRIQTVYDLLQSDDVDMETKGNALRRILKKIEYDGKEKKMKFFYYV